jgi:hypothetical protein
MSIFCSKVGAFFTKPFVKIIVFLQCNIQDMAKPIKSTPILKGKDAINFYAKLEENKSKKVDKATLLAIRESAMQLRSILQPR